MLVGAEIISIVPKCHCFSECRTVYQSESVIFDQNLRVLVCESFHAEEPGYSAGGCWNRHPSERADEAHPKTYGTISCSHLNCLCVGFSTLLGFLVFCLRAKRTAVMRLTLCLQLGIHGYAFAITNNGYILTHPDLRPLVILVPDTQISTEILNPASVSLVHFCPHKLMHNRVRKETSLVGRCAGLV